MELLTPELLLLLWTLLWIASVLLSVIAIIQIIRARFKDTNGRLIWVLIVLFLPVAGSVLYFFFGKKTQVNFK
jgi:hypothetical protein